MIRGMGIDLCDIARFTQMRSRAHFLARCFTEAERAYIEGRGRAADQSLAGHFAAKEAVLKALGCGIVMPLTDVEVTHDAHGAPAVSLHGKALARLEDAGGGAVLLSITHTDTTAAAVAIWEG